MFSLSARHWLLGLGLVAVVATIATWPRPLSPTTYPLASYALFSACLIGAWSVTKETPNDQNRLRAILHLIVSAALAVSIVSTYRYFAASQRWVGGADFFYYLCTARDIRGGVESTPDNAYNYFPGVYTFWRSVMRLTDGSLASFQRAYLAVLLTNAAAVALVVCRATRHLLPAAFAGIWYLAMSTRFEGLSGMTEPLATLPVLIGLLIWNGRTIEGRRGFVLACVFGATLGLALYCKQQAGLLSLGACALLINRCWAPAAERHSWFGMLCIPTAAVVTLSIAVLCEGRGWDPLTSGLRLASNYETRGSWVMNLYHAARNDESTAAAALLAVVTCLFMLAKTRTRDWMREPWMQTVLFCLLAASASLIQFRTRPYYHYGLLGLPLLAVAVVVLGVKLTERLPCDEPARLRLSVLAVLLAAFPLFYTGGNSQLLLVWRTQLPTDFRPHQQLHQTPEVRKQLRQADELVATGESMLVFPPHRTAAYFLLGTRAPRERGYNFAMPDLDEVRWQDLDAVLVYDVGQMEEADSPWNGQIQDEVKAHLTENGFRSVLQGSLLTLYRRNEIQQPSADPVVTQSISPSAEITPCEP